MKAEYRALKSGLVEDKNGAVIYEVVDGVNGKHIATILNEEHKKGHFPDWDFVAERLGQRGQLPVSA